MPVISRTTRVGTIYDDIELLKSIAPNTTEALILKNARGQGIITIKGNGDSQVDIKYSVDGTSDKLLGACNKQLIIAIIFNTSIEIKAINNDISNPRNSSDCSITGNTI